MRIHGFQWAVLLVLLAAALVGLAFAAGKGETDSALQVPPSQAGNGTRAATGFAVVELFTSEGCSSCPLAEAVLADLTAHARKAGLPIMTLAFHVDYFDSADWKDRFGDKAYSSRQADYGFAMKLNDVYTPQMIVNGTKEFVGSDQKTATEAIDAALAKDAVAQVAMTITPANNVPGGYDVGYTVSGAAGPVVVNVAVVERGLKSKVSGGENGGRVLTHENVVRWFSSVVMPADGKGMVAVPRVEGLVTKNASVVVYVQRKGNGAIVGAVAADLR